jgi:hypothetical protein
MRRDEALRAFATATAAAVSTLLVLLVVELGAHHVRIAESVGGAAFAVAFFGSTSLAVAFNPPNALMMRAVLISYVAKTMLIVATLWFVSFDGIDRTVAAVSIVASSLAYLFAQTVSIARRKGRMQRRVARLS